MPNWVTVVCLVVILCPCNLGMGQSKEVLSGVDRPQETIVELPIYEESELDTTNLDWLKEIRVGYDDGFLIASKKSEVAFCRTHSSDLSKLGSKCQIDCEAANDIVQGYEEFAEPTTIMEEKILHWHHVPLF